MPGGWMTYSCDRCPLVIELGGSTLWDEAGVYAKTDQVACAACGTLHRVAEELGECHVTALPGPIRTAAQVTVRDGWGQEFEVEQWFTEEDWRPVGALPGGIEAVGRLACSHCGQAGQILSLGDFLYPDGYAPGAPRREECSECRGPMECIGISDAV